MFNEEEFYDLINLLVEDYGFDEDEAVDIIIQERFDTIVNGTRNLYKNIGDTKYQYEAAKRRSERLGKSPIQGDPNFANYERQRAADDVNAARKKYYGATAKAGVATAAGVAMAGLAAKDAYKRYQKIRPRLQRQRALKRKLRQMKRRSMF